MIQTTLYRYSRSKDSSFSTSWTSGHCYTSKSKKQLKTEVNHTEIRPSQTNPRIRSTLHDVWFAGSTKGANHTTISRQRLHFSACTKELGDVCWTSVTFSKHHCDLKNLVRKRYNGSRWYATLWWNDSWRLFDFYYTLILRYKEVRNTQLRRGHVSLFLKLDLFETFRLELVGWLMQGRWDVTQSKKDTTQI